MQAETVLQVPPISIEPWPTMAIDMDELRIILTYLAYKSKKQVSFGKYVSDEGYSKDSVCVRIAVNDGDRQFEEISDVCISGKFFQLDRSQVKIEPDIDSAKQLQDDNGVILAYVDHNRIIFPVDLTAVDNEASRHILAHVLKEALELLDFTVDAKLLQKRDEVINAFCRLFKNNVGDRFLERQQELSNLKRSADQAYHTIVSYQNKKPIIEKELDNLKRLSDIPEPQLFKKQAKMLVDLAATGDFTCIRIGEDDSIIATTGPITINYQYHDFPMGRYNIIIDSHCHVRMEALDDHPNAEYPHPHVANDGYPCLGNISADVPALLGSMRIAEALQLLYEFLCSYSPDTSPYEVIANFDPHGTFRDENDDPCENCDESSSPYCIGSCSSNTGNYGCSDCSEYRTRYCYRDCEYNESCDLSPCDNCGDKSTESCYLECEYNSDWDRRDPCEDVCEFQDCSAECVYYQKKQELKGVKHANT